jgi:hypothetical protein
MVLTGNIRAASLVVLLFTAGCAGTAPQVIADMNRSDLAFVVHVGDFQADPLERLEKVRAMFYPEGRSLGQRTMAVTSQSQDRAYAKFRENLKWTHNGVTFVAHGILDPENELAPPCKPPPVRTASRSGRGPGAKC